jgi:integrase/recombinase XerD
MGEKSVALSEPKLAVGLTGMHHRGADRVGIYFSKNTALLLLLRPLGVRWSQTYRCWYGPLTTAWLLRLESLLAGMALVDRRGLNAFLANRPIDAAVVADLDKLRGGPEPPIKIEREPAPVGGRYQVPKISVINAAALRNLEQTLILKGYSTSTRKTYINAFRVFLATIKNYDAADFTVARLKDYLEFCFVELKLTEHTIHSRINALKFYYEQVLGREKFFLDIPRPKRPMDLPKLLNEGELSRLFNSLHNKKHKAMLFTAYSAGLRVSEVVALKISDIDSGRMQIRVARAKGKKDRYVGLSVLLLDILRQYIVLFRPKLYLFESEVTGTAYPTRTVQQVFSNAKHKAGILKEVGVHSLRHSFATHLLDKGVDIRYIKDILGHFNIKTTERYLHVSKKQLVNIVSPFDDLMKGGGVDW